MLKMSVVKSLLWQDSILKSTVKVEISFLIFYKDYGVLNVGSICHGAIVPKEWKDIETNITYNKSLKLIYHSI